MKIVIIAALGLVLIMFYKCYNQNLIILLLSVNHDYFNFVRTPHLNTESNYDYISEILVKLKKNSISLLSIYIHLLVMNYGLLL